MNEETIAPIKCPDCRASLAVQPKRCPGCGYQFASDPRANVPTRRRRLMPAQVWILAAIGLVTIWVLLSNERPVVSARPPASGASALAVNPSTASPGSSMRTAAVGDIVMVKPGFWVCGSTKDAFWVLSKLAVARKKEMFAAMRRTRSFALQDGAQVKVLDVGLAATRVRVLGQLDTDDGRIHAYQEDARIGRECWMASEAVAR